MHARWEEADDNAERLVTPTKPSFWGMFSENSLLLNYLEKIFKLTV